MGDPNRLINKQINKCGDKCVSLLYMASHYLGELEMSLHCRICAKKRVIEGSLEVLRSLWPSVVKQTFALSHPDLEDVCNDNGTKEGGNKHHNLFMIG